MQEMSFGAISVQKNSSSESSLTGRESDSLACFDRGVDFGVVSGVHRNNVRVASEQGAARRVQKVFDLPCLAHPRQGRRKGAG